ncbi:MAG: hypothetical protein K0Q57_782, partial [Gammaproteobacteria bacterium]|nr:hypothetical protein [Gammaproteobacteria bacterium]
HKRNANLIIDRAKGLVTVPGDWSMLALIMLIFVVEFAINATEASGPSTTWWFGPLALSISGLITGMALGRNGIYLYRYFTAR